MHYTQNMKSTLYSRALYKVLATTGRANHLNLKQVQISSGNSLVFRVFRQTETFCLFASIFAVLCVKNFFLMAPTKLVSSSWYTMNFAIMNFYL